MIVPGKLVEQFSSVCYLSRVSVVSRLFLWKQASKLKMFSELSRDLNIL